MTRILEMFGHDWLGGGSGLEWWLWYVLGKGG